MLHLRGRIEVPQSCDTRMQTQPALQQGGEDAEVCSETLQVIDISMSTALLHDDKPSGSFVAYNTACHWPVTSPTKSEPATQQWR